MYGVIFAGDGCDVLVEEHDVKRSVIRMMIGFIALFLF
jgi:hypothetical protein